MDGVMFGKMLETLREQIANTSLHMSAQPTGKDGQSYNSQQTDYVIISCGYISGTPYANQDIREMINLADQKFYLSKKAGKNRVTGGIFTHR